jgi:hypothetical protein
MFCTAAGQNRTRSYTASADIVANTIVPRPITMKATIRMSGQRSPRRRSRITPQR